MRRLIFQFSKYALIGLLGAALDLASFWLLTRKLGFSLIPANVISAAIGLTNNFFWNKYWTFKQRSTATLRRELPKFYITATIAYILQQVALPALVLLPAERLIGDREDIAFKVLMMGVAGVTTFFINRAWTFRTRAEKK